MGIDDHSHSESGTRMFSDLGLLQAFLGVLDRKNSPSQTLRRSWLG